MRFDGIEAAGLTVAILAVIVSCVFIAQNSFPTPYSTPPLESTQSVGQEVSKFMWKSRSLDLIAQALVLFGAAVGCLAILRSEKAEKKVKSE